MHAGVVNLVVEGLGDLNGNSESLGKHVVLGAYNSSFLCTSMSGLSIPLPSASQQQY